jgi:TolB-like protein
MATRGPVAAAPQQAPQKPPEVSLTISGGPGTAAHFAVPDFIAIGGDADAVAAGKTIGQVLWDDLNFEREYDMIPRDTYASIPAARSATDVPFDRWRELGADGLVIGTVQNTGAGMRVEVRLYQVATGKVAFAKQYEQAAQRIPSLLSLDQSFILVWPQVVAIVALTVACFAIAYVRFMRQEVRA